MHKTVILSGLNASLTWSVPFIVSLDASRFEYFFGKPGIHRGQPQLFVYGPRDMTNVALLMKRQTSVRRLTEGR